VQRPIFPSLAAVLAGGVVLPACQDPACGPTRADEINRHGPQGLRALHNGDALTWVDLQGHLQGVPVNVARPLGGAGWRVEPNAPIAELKGLRKGVEISRNRDMAWERLMAGRTSERTIAVDLRLSRSDAGYVLRVADAHGHTAEAMLAQRHERSRDAAKGRAVIHEQLGKLGGTLYAAREIRIDDDAAADFLPIGAINALRRDAVAALDAARSAAFRRWLPLPPVEPPVPYPEDTLTYLANVYNQQAAAFYAKHGVKLVGAAYESHEELGDVSLMITKHCVRWSLSLCPKQAKGVQGVQGTVRAEPLVLTSAGPNGGEKLLLRFDCKPCEMHVVGRMRKSVLKQQAAEVPLTFYRQRPAARRD
jgi:putative protease